MVFILVFSFLWGLFLTWFVLSPLFSRSFPFSTSFPRKRKSKGTSLDLSIIIGFILFSSIVLFTNKSFAVDVKSDVVLPPPTILPNTGYWLPSVNQYILTPQQGMLHVYYVGMFLNTFHAKGTKILLPFPKNIKNVSIILKKTASLDKTNNDFVLNTPLNDDANQIQAEFSLQADAGSLVWQKNSLDVLPGVTIIMLEKGIGQFLNFPKDFKQMENSNQFVRVGNSFSNFPEFEIIDIVPSRFYIYLLILIFFCFLITALVVYFLTLKKQSVDLASKQEDRYTHN